MLFALTCKPHLSKHHVYTDPPVVALPMVSLHLKSLTAQVRVHHLPPSHSIVEVESPGEEILLNTTSRARLLVQELRHWKITRLQIQVLSMPQVLSNDFSLERYALVRQGLAAACCLPSLPIPHTLHGPSLGVLSAPRCCADWRYVLHTRPSAFHRRNEYALL